MPTTHSFVHFTCLHLSPQPLFGRVDPLVNFEECLRLIETSGYRPEALVLGGDLTHESLEETFRQVRDLVEPFAARLGAQVMYLPGNHDHDKRALRAGLYGDSDDERRLDQVLWLGGLRIVGLDSSVPHAEHGALAEDQLTWLAEELERPAPQGTVVVMHHQPIPTPEPVIDSLALRSAAELETALNGTDVRLVIAGHTHHACAGQLGSIPVWAGPGVAWQTDMLVGTHRYVAGGGFSRIDVFEDAVASTPVMLSRQPETLYEGDLGEVFALLAKETSGQVLFEVDDGQRQ